MIEVETFDSPEAVEASLAGSPEQMGNIRWITKEGHTVRFLGGPETWVKFSEWYNRAIKAYVVYRSDDDIGDTRRSWKYLAPVLDHDHGRVFGYKIPYKLAKDLLEAHKATGDLTKMDYKLVRVGDGMNDTSYSAVAVGAATVAVDAELPNLVDWLTEHDEQMRNSPEVTPAEHARDVQAARHTKQQGGLNLLVVRAEWDAVLGKDYAEKAWGDRPLDDRMLSWDAVERAQAELERHRAEQAASEPFEQPPGPADEEPF